jgi:hypothetical protein
VRLRHVPLALAALTALVASACSGGAGAGDPAEAAGPLSAPNNTEVAAGAVAETPIAPLTGLPDESGVVASRPALSVKIDNAPKARPQAGLDVADIVFEEVVEGGVTRFIAVFHSSAPGTVGPIRSVRPMDPKIVSALGGLVAYSGGIPEYVALMRRAPIQDLNIDVATSAYRWDKGRPRPHDLFASPDELWAMAKESFATPPPALFEYRTAGDRGAAEMDSEPFGEADAASVGIPYSPLSSAAYTWDPASGTWKRTQDGAPHMAASGAQIAPQNLVVQFVSTRRLGKVDRSGHAVRESIVTGDGEAWVLSGGRVAKGRWSKPEAGSTTRYLDAAGNAMKLAPGRTWVHFVPVGSPVSTG